MMLKTNFCLRALQMRSHFFALILNYLFNMMFLRYLLSSNSQNIFRFSWILKSKEEKKALGLLYLMEARPSKLCLRKKVIQFLKHHLNNSIVRELVWTRAAVSHYRFAKIREKRNWLQSRMIDIERQRDRNIDGGIDETKRDRNTQAETEIMCVWVEIERKGRRN